MIRTANLTGSVSRNAGGLFDSVRRLVQSLDQLGMDVCVFGIEDEHSEADLSAWKPVDVLAFKPCWPEPFGYSPDFIGALLDFEPHVTHTHGLWVYPSIATNAYCRRKRSCYLISPHGMLDPWAVQNSRWKKVIAHWLYEETHLRGAQCLRALCESEAQAIRKLGLKNKIAIIPNGIDLTNGKPPAAPPWADCVRPGAKVILFLSRIHPKKGLANLLQAWANIQKSLGKGRVEEWVLAIAGWDQGGHETELKQLATALDLSWTDLRGRDPDRESVPHPTIRDSSSVIFLGPQFNDAKAACYHHCNAFVLPSFSEGLPMVILEAWANHKPVLMTPECNLPEGFAAAAALKSEPAVAELELSIRELFAMSENERLSMGARGHALVSERFVWPRIAAQTQQLYEWMLGGGPQPQFIVDF